jgi:hypothetical protein
LHESNIVGYGFQELREKIDVFIEVISKIEINPGCFEFAVGSRAFGGDSSEKSPPLRMISGAELP